ncbi:hypothetical protein pb186bvf_009770 [Paramecium bursaria]
MALNKFIFPGISIKLLTYNEISVKESQTQNRRSQLIVKKRAQMKQ